MTSTADNPDLARSKHSKIRPFQSLLGTSLFLMSMYADTGWAKCKIESFDIPVTMSGLRAVANLRINGTEVPFTVDSGAFYSYMTQAAAEQLKLPLRFSPFRWNPRGVTGTIETRMTRVERVGFQNVELHNIEFLVGGNEPGQGTMGLLGRNLLGWADTEYNLANGMVRIMRPTRECGSNVNMAYWAGSTPVSIAALYTKPDSREVTPPILAQVLLNGKRLTAMFDTGAPTSVLSLRAAKRAGVIGDEKSLKPAGTVHGAGTGEARSWTLEFKSFELGDEQITNNRIQVADFDNDGFDMLIGMDFFLSHRIYVSNSQDRMYFTYNGGPVFDMSIKTTTEARTSEAETPKDAEGFARRGAAFAARGDLAHALNDLDRACELAPTVAAYYLQRGRIHLRLQHWSDAKLNFNDALQFDPGNHEARLERARLSLAMRQVGPATDDLRLLTNAIAAQANMHREIGDLYVAAGKAGEAVPNYDRWIASHRNDVDLPYVLNSRCWARALSGSDLDKALADCNEALDAKPDQAHFRDSRGLVYLRQEKLKNAVADYDEALKSNPKLAWAMFGRGLAYLRLGESDRGKADIAAARQLRPSIEAEAKAYGLAAP